MFDLSTAFRKKASDSKVLKSVCLGLILAKDALVEPVLKALKEAGVDTAKKEDSEDAVLFRLSDEKYTDEEVTIVKMSGDCAVMLKGFDPYKNSEKMSFREVLKAQGFMPGVSMAMDSLHTTIRTALQSEDQTEAVKKIETVLDEFKGYVKQLAQDIPAMAFKAEALVSKALDDHEATLEKDKDKNTPPVVKTPEEMIAAGESDENVLKAHKDMTADKLKELRTKAEDEKKKKTDTPIDAKALVTEVVKSMGTVLADQIKEQMKPVADTLKTVQTQLDGVVTKQGELATEVKTVGETAKKAEKAANSIVLATPNDDPARVNKKEDDDGELGVIDTAYQPQVRKQDRTFAQRKFPSRARN